MFGPILAKKKAGQIWNASTVVLVFLLGFRARQAGESTGARFESDFFCELIVID